MRRVSAKQPELDAEASRLRPAYDRRQSHLAVRHVVQHQAQGSPEAHLALALDEHPAEADVPGRAIKGLPFGRDAGDLEADGNPMVFALLRHDQCYGPVASLINSPPRGVQHLAG